MATCLKAISATLLALAVSAALSLFSCHQVYAGDGDTLVGSRCIPPPCLEPPYEPFTFCFDCQYSGRFQNWSVHGTGTGYEQSVANSSLCGVKLWGYCFANGGCNLKGIVEDLKTGDDKICETEGYVYQIGLASREDP